MLIDRRGKSSQQQSNNDTSRGKHPPVRSPINPTDDEHKRHRRIVSLRSEIGNLLVSVRRTVSRFRQRRRRRDRQGRPLPSNPYHNPHWLASKTLVLLLLGWTLLAWYILHDGGIDQRRRMALCRSHRSADGGGYSVLYADLDGNVEDDFQFQLAPLVVNSEDGEPYGEFEPDYGGLLFRMSGPYVERSGRKLGLHSEDYYWKEFVNNDGDDEENMDHYYMFDDDGLRNHQWVKQGKTCRRVAWHRMYNPSCNQMHEVEIMTKGNKYLGSGFYRDVFLVSADEQTQDMVYKLNRNKANKYKYDRYEFIRMDALIMERLTASPRIPDIFGHCGTSMLTEYLSVEIEPIMTPGSGKHYEDDLDDGNDVRLFNEFTPKQKITTALVMAEAIADLHGFRDGVMVHDDIMPSQFLYATDGSLKLNDFNRGEAMLFDEEAGEYCRYRNGKGGGDFRSPEEFMDGRLNEKIDVFSLGNMMYGLLTGLLPFYDVKKDKEIQRRMVDGETAFIHPKFRTRSYAEGRLVQIIEMCYEFDPDDRPEIFEVVRFLKDTVKQMNRIVPVQNEEEQI